MLLAIATVEVLLKLLKEEFILSLQGKESEGGFAIKELLELSCPKLLFEPLKALEKRLPLMPKFYVLLRILDLSTCRNFVDPVKRCFSSFAP